MNMEDVKQGSLVKVVKGPWTGKVGYVQYPRTGKNETCVIVAFEPYQANARWANYVEHPIILADYLEPA